MARRSAYRDEGTMDGDDAEDSLEGSERARERRRDRRYSAQEREMMSTGPAKVFAQIMRRIVDDAAQTPAEHRKRKAGRRSRGNSGR